MKNARNIARGLALGLVVALASLSPARALAADVPLSQYGLIRTFGGTPVLLGTITATTTKNNHDTAVPFNNTGTGLANRMLVFQCSAACRIRIGTANTVTSSTSTGFYLEANTFSPPIIMAPAYGWVAMVPASGSSSTDLMVWELVI